MKPNRLRAESAGFAAKLRSVLLLVGLMLCMAVSGSAAERFTPSMSIEVKDGKVAINGFNSSYAAKFCTVEGNAIRLVHDGGSPYQCFTTPRDGISANPPAILYAEWRIKVFESKDKLPGFTISLAPKRPDGNGTWEHLLFFSRDGIMCDNTEIKTPSWKADDFNDCSLALDTKTGAFQIFVNGQICLNILTGRNGLARKDPFLFAGDGSSRISGSALLEYLRVGSADASVMSKEAPQGDVPATWLVTGTTDSNPTAYKPGEKMVFTIRVTDKDTPVKFAWLKWNRDGDDGVKQEGFAEVTPQKPLVVTTSLDRPGFVRVTAQLCNAEGELLRRNNKIVEFDGGAGVELDKIRQAVPEPEDFDAYWDRQKKRLAEVPIVVEQREKMECKVPGIDFYVVTVKCAGPQPVTGYLAIPSGAKAKSLPARLFYYGYNYQPRFPTPQQLKTDRISFFVNAHGFKLQQSSDYYRNFAATIKDGEYDYAFSPRQNANPDTAYFNGMALRVMRSLQYVKTLPEWNGRDLVADGYSQGGLQAVWAAGLDADVNLCSADIPWGCDMGGVTIGRAVGPWRLPYVRGLDYYDTVNHIKRAKCPLVIPRAGLGDYVCPPSGVTILYNNAPNAKRINYRQGSQHGYVPPRAQSIVIESGKIPVIP